MPPSDRDAWLFEPEDDLRETVAAAVHRRLIDMILFGELAQGSRLILADLARRFDVSLTPVREALQRLGESGLIEAEPRRGYRVRTPSPRHVRDLWDVRRGLETVAAGSAAARVRAGEIGAPDLEPARRILAEIDRAPRSMDHRRHLELNARFHQSVVTLSGNALLVTLYRGIQFQLITAWVQRGSAAWRDRLAAESAEHHAILGAIAAGDAAAASAAMASHVSRSLGSALADLEAPPPGAKTGTQRLTGRTP
jgi:DNA-binding GntR family transcriptional regulator